jgi:hypothetical protein
MEAFIHVSGAAASSIAPAAEESKQEQEQVDEIEV